MTPRLYAAYAALGCLVVVVALDAAPRLGAFLLLAIVLGLLLTAQRRGLLN